MSSTVARQNAPNRFAQGLSYSSGDALRLWTIGYKLFCVRSAECGDFGELSRAVRNSEWNSSLASLCSC